MRTHYGPWQPCWILNQHQKSVQRFQRRRFKGEKLMDGRLTLTHDKSSHDLWPGELKTNRIQFYL